MRGRAWLRIGGLASATAIMASPLPAQQSGGTPVFPEENAYCQPARTIMARYFDGARPLDVSAREARTAAQGCERTNPLGYYLSLAQIASAEGNNAEAFRLGQAALAVAPGNSEALRRICVSHSDKASALATCRKAVAAAPNSSLAHRSLGDTLREQNRPAEAIPAYDRALAITPNHHAARINRGVAYLALKQFAPALADFEALDRALGDNDLNASAIARNRARALEGLNRPADALAVLTERLRVAPTDHWARLQRGELLVRTGQIDEGYRECSAVMNIAGTRNAAFKCRGDAADRARAKKAADDAAAEARKKNCRRAVATTTGRPADLRLMRFTSSPGKTFFGGGSLYYELSQKQRINVTFNIHFEGEVANPGPTRLEVSVYNDLLWGASPRDVQFYSDYVRAQVLYRDKGYPLRIEIRSGGFPVTIEKASELVNFTADFGSSSPTSQQVQEIAVGRKIAETGRFTLRVWNANTGEKLLDREFVISGLSADRQSIYQGYQALQVANPPGMCMS